VRPVIVYRSAVAMSPSQPLKANYTEDAATDQAPCHMTQLMCHVRDGYPPATMMDPVTPTHAKLARVSCTGGSGVQCPLAPNDNISHGDVAVCSRLLRRAAEEVKPAIAQHTFAATPALSIRPVAGSSCDVHASYHASYPGGP
jgi:hypothetical protein